MTRKYFCLENAKHYYAKYQLDHASRENKCKGIPSIDHAVNMMIDHPEYGTPYYQDKKEKRVGFDLY
ncbi:MAG: hypothetical protein OEQ53_06485 [Saprospiraceae bacterium]|nr:hypothetical protein [Saprospiraceae bacterium]